MENKKKKPIDIQSNFGTIVLSCPYCKKPVYNKYGEHKLISPCVYCGKEFDTSLN